MTFPGEITVFGLLIIIMPTWSLATDGTFIRHFWAEEPAIAIDFCRHYLTKFSFKSLKCKDIVVGTSKKSKLVEIVLLFEIYLSGSNSTQNQI